MKFSRFHVWDLGFSVRDSGFSRFGVSRFGVLGSGVSWFCGTGFSRFGVCGSKFRVRVLWFWVFAALGFGFVTPVSEFRSLSFRVQGSGFLGYRVSRSDFVVFEVQCFAFGVRGFRGFEFAVFGVSRFRVSRFGISRSGFGVSR